jgi:hypothetical protein
MSGPPELPAHTQIVMNIGDFHLVQAGELPKVAPIAISV